MADNLRQRRGKKSASGGGSSAAAETPSSPSASHATNNGEGNTKKEELAPIDQLRNARAKLAMSRDRTADLHAAWRGQLFRLSLLVFFVSIYQLQNSISACIKEIKTTGGGGEEGVSGAASAKLIFGDSFCELLGVCIASLLAYFLALSTMVVPLGLDHWPYMLSSALVPICLGMFFHSEPTGCISLGGEDAIDNNSAGEESTADDNDPRHQFPAVVVYHTIVTVAFWFMKSGLRQAEDHVSLVDKSIEDFTRMDKKIQQKAALKKKLKGNPKKK